MVTDPYSVLGISKGASKEEIKRAYRKKAKEYHPDLHPDDPRAAEKMNEINEAYDMLSNPEKYQKREQERTYRQSTYGQGPYGNTGGQRYYGGQGHYQQGDFWGFDFEDMFGFGQRHQSLKKPSRQPGDSEDICKAVDFICMGRYEFANQILNRIVSSERNSRWHYLNALANYGMGNEIRALEELQKAIQMEPNNQEYRQAFESMRQTGNAYQASGQDFQKYAEGLQKSCMTFCALQFLCGCCCI